MAKKLENGLYVGCALSHAPKEFCQGVESVKADLRQRGYNILDFVVDESATPEEVFEWDLNCVESCDAMLAIADYPSQGLGWEMATATRLGKPTLAVAEIGRKVTRFTIGAAGVLPSFEFERYRYIKEVPAQFDQFLGRVLLDDYEAAAGGVQPVHSLLAARTAQGRERRFLGTV